MEMLNIQHRSKDMTGSVFKEKVMSDLNMTIGKLLNFYRYILGNTHVFKVFRSMS